MNRNKKYTNTILVSATKEKRDSNSIYVFAGIGIAIEAIKQVKYEY
ncbi:MAG: hypothetical protein K8S00_05020 [Bacteroidales bacterium]|nr:hypothetical protein [Bacteroidales bacterium]